MKKIIFALIIFLACCFSVLAEDNIIEPEEINLEPVQEGLMEMTQAITVSEEADNSSAKTLKEKLHDVYNLEVYKYDKPSYLFDEILTYNYNEDSKMDKIHFWAGYNGDIGLNFSDNGHFTNHYDINALNVGFDGYLKNNNADFRVLLGFSPRLPRNYIQGLFTDVYIATNKVPHHRFLLGHSRPPVGMEGGSSAYTLPFLARSQISRNFGTVRKVGGRMIGNYSLVDYDLGVYSSDSFFQEFFPGAEFIGWINFKPLAKTDGKYGSVKIGGGIETGQRDSNFCVTGAYLGWEYKKFAVDFEWGRGCGNDHAYKTNPVQSRLAIHGLSQFVTFKQEDEHCIIIVFRYFGHPTAI